MLFLTSQNKTNYVASEDYSCACGSVTLNELNQPAQVGEENGNCSIPSPYDVSDLMEYDPGQIVWAKLSRYPWWPGMIDYATTLQYYKKTSRCEKYNVRFFGKHVLQQWIDQLQICTYAKNPPVCITLSY
ncbi:hypothetical protein TNCV_1379311 [Trichonephila clavipes]|nr:hypothetical protein TNCV_1379311 [Trichonephila clavipes]